MLNNVRLARCFFYVSGVLQQVIDNGGTVVSLQGQKIPFYMTPQQISQVVLPDHGLRITEFTALLYAAVDNPAMKRPGTTAITNWLVEQRMLQKVTGQDGKQRARFQRRKGCGWGCIPKCGRECTGNMRRCIMRRKRRDSFWSI